jgi:hypothetical protein
MRNPFTQTRNFKVEHPPQTQAGTVFNIIFEDSFVNLSMAKAKKTEKPTPKQYLEKVAIDVDFEQAIKMFADHANTKGTKKITYGNRSRLSQ